jgi:hypothetical protein
VNEDLFAKFNPELLACNFYDCVHFLSFLCYSLRRIFC